MKKKGFTLIELLATIVIIAAVALISTPIVLNVVETARQNSFVDSAKIMIDETSKYLIENKLNDVPENGIDVQDLNVKNKEQFVSGKIIKNEENEVEIRFLSDGVYCANGTAADLAVVKDTCDKLDTTIPILDEKKIQISKNSNSIKVIVPSDAITEMESHISKYKYVINGTEKISEDNEYVFKNLQNGVLYEIKISVINSNDLESEVVIKNIVTDDITAPAYSIDKTGWQQKKVVTITYPTRKTGFKYEYSIDGGSNWTTVSDDIEKTVEFTKNGSVIARIYDGVNYKTASTYTVTQIDTTAPTAASITVASKTTNTITVTGSGTDNESGIVKYEFAIDNGLYSNNGSNPLYTFARVTEGTHTIKLRVTNGSGLTKETYISTNPNVIETPKYSVDKTGWQQSKVVTITYPTRETGFIYTYSTDGGINWRTLTSGTTAAITFTTPGSVIARVFDGTNYKTTSSYTVSQVDSTAPIEANITIASKTTNSITVTGTGVDNESGIVKYEFAMDSGTYVNNGGNASYTFAKVTEGTHIVKLRVTNGSGLTKETKVSTNPKIIATPTYSINGTGWKTSKIVTITYPSREPGFVYTYSTDGGVNWTTVDNDKTSADVTFTSNGNVVAKIYDGTNYKTASTYTVSQVDSTAPTAASITVKSKTTNSISVIAAGTDNESGIIKYEFAIDNGAYVNNGTNVLYTFTKVTEGTHTLKVRVTNGSGLTKESTLSTNPNVIATPTYSTNKIGWQASKIVTITYPARQTGFKYEYSLNGGSNWTEVTNGTTASLEFTANGSVIARVSDGTNFKTASSYTVSQIDTTAPTAASITVKSKTTNSITVNATGTDEESGIVRYEFAIDDGAYVNNGTNASYIYTKVKEGTHTLKVKVTNGSGLSREASISSNPNVIATPTYSVDKTGWQQSKTVTITYPVGSEFTYQYSIDGGTNWTTVSSGIEGKVTFTTPGSVIARVYDGTNYKTASSFTVSQVDSTAPTAASITVASTTTSTITVTGSGIDSESGIVKYEFAIDGGAYVNNGSSPSYTYTKVTEGDHVLKLRVTNGSGLTKETTASSKPRIIPTPTYSIDKIGWQQSKVVTITYPTRETGFKYEYSIDGGNTWKTVDNGVTVNVTFTTPGSVIARVTDGINYKTASTYTVAQVDSTAPTSASITVASKTTNSITVTGSGIDSESGIVKYEYAIDSGTYVSNGSNASYKFTKVTEGTHTLKIRVTNGSGLTKETSISSNPNIIPTPTYSANKVGWQPSKLITITYPTRQTDFVYTYSTDGGTTWTTVSSGNTVTLEFKSNGNLIARVTDGTNYKTASTYTVAQIDSTAPTSATITVASKTSNSITVTSSGIDSESGIVKYEYAIDSGAYVSNGSNASYTYTGVKTGDHTLKVRVTNGAGLTKEASTTTAPNYCIPTYSIDKTGWQAKKIVTVTYPTCGTNLKYQYSTDGGSTWTTLTSGITSAITFTTNGNIIARVYDGTNYMSASSFAISQVDSTPPSAATITVTGKTTNTIAVTATGADNESGIVKYEFALDSGAYISNGTSTSYTYTGVKTGDHTVKVRVTNGSGLTKEASTTVAVNVCVPTYSIDKTGWQQKKTVTISHACGTGKTFQYSTNAGSTWITVSGTTIAVPFTAPGSVIARIYDGTNYMAAISYTVAQVDSTAPTAGVSISDTTSNSITAKATGTDAESGIVKYEFAIDSGAYVNNGTNTSYKFENVKTGDHIVKVRVTNGSGLTKEASAATGTKYCIPTYSIDKTGWQAKKNVTITYTTCATKPTYQYSTNGGSTWTTVSGTSVTVPFTANGSVIARIYDGTNYMSASSYTVAQIDATAPSSASITVSSKTSNSIVVKATATDAESGIAKYEFAIDSGAYVSNGTNTSYTYTGVKTGNHTLKLRVTNGSGLTKEVTTTSEPNYCIPTYSVNKTGWQQSKVVTVTYPTCATKPVNQYSIDGGSTWSTVSGTTSTHTFTANGSVIARVYDGTNYMSASSYSVAQIDRTAPTAASIAVSTKTTNTVTAVAAGTDAESGITKYEFAMDSGAYVNNGSNKNYTYTGVKTGAHTIKVRVTNGSGLTKESSTVSVDVGACIPSYSVDKTGWQQKKIVTISHTCGTGKTFQYSTDNGSTWTTATGTSTTVSFTAPGTVIARVYDGTNYMTASSYTVAQVDSTAPNTATITISNRTSNSISVKATGTDSQSGIVKYEYAIDSGAYVNNGTTTSFTYSNIKTGDHTVRVRVTNGSGLTKEATASTSILGCPPTYSVDKTGWQQTKIVTITYPTCATNPTYQYSINNGTSWTNVTAGASATISFTANGSVIARTYDGTNYMTASTYTVAQIDRTAPTVSLASTDLQPASITVKSTGTDAESGISKYEFAIGTGSYVSNGTNSSYTFSGLTQGTAYTIKTRVTNGSGLTKETSASMTTKNVTAPGITVSPSGWTTKKTATISYPAGTGYKYYYSTNGGTSWTNVTSTSTTITFTATGTLVAKVTYDNDKKYVTSSSFTISQVDSTAPSAASISATSSTTNTVTVKASGTDAESGISKYEYAIDSGSYVSNGANTTYTYSGVKTGTHTVKVRVTNASGLTREASSSTAVTQCIPSYSVNKTGWATSKIVTISHSCGTSGKTFQYSTNGGSTWTTVSATSTTVTFTANGSVIARIYDGTNYMTASSLTVSQVDSTAPSAASITVSSNTASAITVTGSGTDAESGISKYEFAIDSGAYVNNGTNKTYTYTGLTQGTNHTLKLRVTNATGLTKEASTSRSTTAVAAPGITVSPSGWAKSKNVTITYPSGTGYTYQYSRDKGSTWTTVTSPTTTVSFSGGVTYSCPSGYVMLGTTKCSDPNNYSINNFNTYSSSQPYTSESLVMEYVGIVNQVNSCNGDGVCRMTFTHQYRKYNSVKATTVSVQENTLIARVSYDNGSKYVSGSSLTISQVDPTAPTAADFTYTVNADTIKVVASGTDAESGISGYQFSKDNGSTWTSYQTSNTYTFTNLNRNTYSIKVRAYNGTYGNNGSNGNFKDSSSQYVGVTWALSGRTFRTWALTVTKTTPSLQSSEVYYTSDYKTDTAEYPTSYVCWKKTGKCIELVTETSTKSFYLGSIYNISDDVVMVEWEYDTYADKTACDGTDYSTYTENYYLSSFVISSNNLTRKSNVKVNSYGNNNDYYGWTNSDGTSTTSSCYTYDGEKYMKYQYSISNNFLGLTWSTLANSTTTLYGNISEEQTLTLSDYYNGYENESASHDYDKYYASEKPISVNITSGTITVGTSSTSNYTSYSDWDYKKAYYGGATDWQWTLNGFSIRTYTNNDQDTFKSEKFYEPYHGSMRTVSVTDDSIEGYYNWADFMNGSSSSMYKVNKPKVTYTNKILKITIDYIPLGTTALHASTSSSTATYEYDLSSTIVAGDTLSTTSIPITEGSMMNGFYGDRNSTSTNDNLAYFFSGSNGATGKMYIRLRTNQGKYIYITGTFPGSASNTTIGFSKGNAVSDLTTGGSAVENSIYRNIFTRSSTNTTMTLYN